MLGLLAATLLWGVTPDAVAQQMRDLMEEALDQNVRQIELKQLPLHDALQQLGEQTGLRFELADGVLDRMPYGERTRVSIVIQDMPLRVGLRRVLGGLGLVMNVADERVQVGAAPVLERLDRRLTIAETAVLGLLASEPWSALPRDGVVLVFQLDPHGEPRAALDAALAQIPAENALEQFDLATAALGWVWLPREKGVVFLARRDDVRRRLERPVDLTYSRVPLDQVLVDLGRRVGVTMLFEPGALRQVQASARPVDLIQRETSVRQTLERICGNTGLRYEIVDDGVRISGPAEAVQRPVNSAARLVRISIPLGPGGAMIDYIIREDELPPEVRREYADRLQGVLEELTRQLSAGDG
ncbi:MAG: DUF4974 domain-containing protein [Planctomycetes bacterium]|nr:DUF4974 domain-containing protein [Planctomycetota bacterium]